MRIFSLLFTVVLTLVVGMMFEMFREFVHLIASLCVIGILTVESDDVYGLSNLRKMSKRQWRKFTKQLAKESKKHFGKKKAAVSES